MNNMRKYFPIILTIFLFVSCSAPMRFIVTNLGYEPDESNGSIIYALPKTSLKVSLSFRRDLFIPGPYADYAQRMLGIDGAQKVRTERYSVNGVTMEAFAEPDGNRFFTLNQLQGYVDWEKLISAESNGLILRGNFGIKSDIIQPLKEQQSAPELIFKDVTMESNVEMKQQTMYKTIITDTSFINVPVTSQQMERKTLEKKAEEAAKLILEIRSDRYFLAAGIVDPFPDNFDMKTALGALDKLEADYLSLFVGKSYSEQLQKEYIVSPEGATEDEKILLDKFSAQTGIEDPDGENIEIEISPEGNARSFRNLLPQQPEPESYNLFYYRIPEVCNISINLADQTLLRKKLSIYQSGSLVSEKIGEEHCRLTLRRGIAK